MKIASYSDLRRNLASMIDSVVEDHVPVIITRDGGRSSAVLMSLEDFASYDETRYLVRNPANAERLVSAINDLEAGFGVEKTID